MACQSLPGGHPINTWQQTANTLAAENLNAAKLKVIEEINAHQTARIKQITVLSIQTDKTGFKYNAAEPREFNCLDELKVRVKYHPHSDYTHDKFYDSPTQLMTGNRPSATENVSAKSYQEIYGDLKRIMEQFLKSV